MLPQERCEQQTSKKTKTNVIVAVFFDQITYTEPVLLLCANCNMSLYKGYCPFVED